ncbi:H-NS family nucleoid-associated regulatory protein [Primorskyibacter flagellatus]|uniref:DNA-binding protein H-NS n=1 Tax=Primorskyibacter flagellatus TaxID=1387277 RepID=A0A1W2ARL8_9RHOB|nr:H-NS histone family protein [Primorskyibacter flagellatus]SMC63335.1 DNA-binding protein H-NS [Primorskyibacter flagellatus]
MSIDLSALSRQELTALRKNVDKALDTLETRRRAEALKAAEDAAKEFGFSLSELNSSTASSKKTKGAPKFVNPEDPSQTWTGRGRKPNWVVVHLDAGKPLEDLAL